MSRRRRHGQLSISYNAPERRINRVLPQNGEKDDHALRVIGYVIPQQKGKWYELLAGRVVQLENHINSQQPEIFLLFVCFLFQLMKFVMKQLDILDYFVQTWTSAPFKWILSANWFKVFCNPSMKYLAGSEWKMVETASKITEESVDVVDLMKAHTLMKATLGTTEYSSILTLDPGKLENNVNSF